MTTYVNKSSEMQTIRFEDGSAAFLRRGQKYTSSKKVEKMGAGIKTVADKKTAKTESDSASN
jgi:hypothetical protein